MRFVVKVAVTMLMLAVAGLACWLITARMAPAPRLPQIATWSAGPTIEQIQLLAALTTLKVDVADAIVTDLHGYLGNTRAVLVVRGDVTLGVDLSVARFESVNEASRTAVLILPPPTVQSVRVDHERSRLIDIRTGGVWLIVPGGSNAEMAVVNRGYRDAQRIVGSVATDPALLARARRQAEQVLRAFFAALGWEVVVRWT